MKNSQHFFKTLSFLYLILHAIRYNVSYRMCCAHYKAANVQKNFTFGLHYVTGNQAKVMR